MNVGASQSTMRRKLGSGVAKPDAQAMTAARAWRLALVHGLNDGAGLVATLEGHETRPVEPPDMPGLLANGDLAHVILFGVFAGFAILGRRIIDRRQRRLMGAETWERVWDAVAHAPRFSRPGVETIIRVAAGVALYLALLALHPLVIGVSPLP